MNDIEQLRNWRNNIHDTYQGAYRKQWDRAITKKSMRAAVNAKCQECMNWQYTEVKQCNLIHCPLWQYRPNQEKESTREAEIREIAKTITGDAPEK